MKALTIQHPWALALALGIKPVENRDWRYPPPRQIVGQRIALHASKAVPADTTDILTEMLADDIWPTTLLPPEATDEDLEQSFEDDVHRLAGDCRRTAGCVLAVGTLARVIEHGDGDPLNDSRWRAEARFGLVFTDVVRLAVPVLAKGALGFWDLPPDVQRAVDEQLAKARAEQGSGAGR